VRRDVTVADIASAAALLSFTLSASATAVRNAGMLRASSKVSKVKDSS